MSTTTDHVRHRPAALPARLRNGGIVLVAGLLAIYLGLRVIAPGWLYGLLIAVLGLYMILR